MLFNGVPYVEIFDASLLALDLPRLRIYGWSRAAHDVAHDYLARDDCVLRLAVPRRRNFVSAGAAMT